MQRGGCFWIISWGQESCRIYHMKHFVLHKTTWTLHKYRRNPLCYACLAGQLREKRSAFRRERGEEFRGKDACYHSYRLYCFFQAVGWVISCDTGKGIASLMLFGDTAYLWCAVRIGLLITTHFKVSWLSFDSGWLCYLSQLNTFLKINLNSAKLNISDTQKAVKIVIKILIVTITTAECQIGSGFCSIDGT